MNFLIENKLQDFSLSLIEAIEYKNWYSGDNSYSYSLIDTIPDILIEQSVPVGSIDFVQKYTKKFYKKVLLPYDITNLSKDILNRNITTESQEVERIGKEVFVKNYKEFKELTGIFYTASIDFDSLKEKKYFFSEILEIQSEYRIFVYNGKIVGIKHYLGDVYKIPSLSFLKDVVEEIKDRDVYSFDVASTTRGEALIEVHDIFSLGLYGFDEKKYIPQMFYRGYFNALKNSIIFEK